MSNTIHGSSHKIIKAFREKPAALPVYWIYIARANNDNVAWPTLRGLAEDTDWCKDACDDGRKWLVEHGALEPVENYIRPQWRKLSPQDLARKLNFDHAEYYRPTGVITINNKTYPLLYVVTNQESDESEQTADVLPDLTSDEGGHQPRADVSPERTELDSIEDSQDSTTPESSNDDSPATDEKSTETLTSSILPLNEIENPKRRKTRASPKPPREKTERPRNPRMDCIAFFAFGVKRGNKYGEGVGGRVGKILKELEQTFDPPLVTADLANIYTHARRNQGSTPESVMIARFRKPEDVVGLANDWIAAGKPDYNPAKKSSSQRHYTRDDDERVPPPPVPEPTVDFRGYPLQKTG